MLRRVAATAVRGARGYSTAPERTPVIVSAVRTPIGSFGGALASLSGSQLGAVAVKEAVRRAGVDPSLIGEAFLGNVVSAGMGQAPARQAVLFAGLPESIPCTTVNKVCASGMKTVMMAAQSIMLGHQDVVLAGGFESMSNIPYYVPKARTGLRYGHGELLDGVLKDGLWDVYNDVHMGNAGEDCATKHSFTREQQDDFAIASYERAAAAHQAGHFKGEIVGVDIKGRKGVTTVDMDEEYSKVSFDKVRSLRPAFDRNGTITAANASSLNDGASALVLTSLAKAQELGLKPLAKVTGFADAARAPIEFTIAPADATPKALKMAGVSVEDVDYFEINEAFSVVVLANMKLMKVPHDKVNVLGGAVALGHPIGCSGARIVTTLTHLLQNNGKKVGCASICNGGGGASAIVIESM